MSSGNILRELLRLAADVAVGARRRALSVGDLSGREFIQPRSSEYAQEFLWDAIRFRVVGEVDF